jgi:hypothetical protein
MKNQPIKIIFARNRYGSSKYIQWVTWSRYSHVVIVDGDEVIHAGEMSVKDLFLILFGIKKNSLRLGGVRKMPLSKFLSLYEETRTAYIDGDINIARDMVNKVMYDCWGLVGIRFRCRIDCDDKMTCSKVVWMVATHCRDSFSHRAEPQRLLEISRDNYDITAP